MTPHEKTEEKSRLNSGARAHHGTQVESVRYRHSPVNLVGQDSTKKCVQYDFKITQVYSEKVHPI